MSIFLPIVGADFPKTVIPLLNSAQRNIDIISYDWRWYANQPGHPVQQFNIALVRARQRGVMVRVVLNSKELLPLLNSLGIDARPLSDKRTLHSKLILIDEKIVIIGSHNLTRNAFAHNIETSLVVDIPEGNDRFSQLFKNLWGV